MSNAKKDLAIAYAVKRRASQQRPSLASIELPEDFADDKLWADDNDEPPLEEWVDLPEEAVKETPETRVARIMQNFRLSNLGNKSDD